MGRRSSPPSGMRPRYPESCCDHVFRVRLYYGHSTGVVAGLLVRLAQAHGELGDSERADHYFGEADKIYRVVPGVKHPFYFEVGESSI